MFEEFKKKNNEKKLFTAIEKNHTALAEKLIERMDDVSQKNNEGDTALMYAVYKGHTALAEKLIERMDDVSQKNSDGNTILIWAIYKGHTALAQKLIERMGDVSQKNNEGDTALMYAVKKGHTALAEKLIEKMDDVSQKDNDGNTALSTAEDKGVTDIVKLIKLKTGDHGAILLDLIEKGELEKAKELVKDQGTKKGRLALAVKTQNVELATRVLFAEEQGDLTDLSKIFSGLSKGDSEKLSEAFTIIANALKTPSATPSNDDQKAQPAKKTNKITKS